MTEGLDADQLGEERDFLLGSLEDLEREHAAGDLDEHDYAALKDDYTSRAARVLRALEADQAIPTEPGRNPRRTAGVVAVVLIFAVVSGVLVAQAAGRRDPGDVATGGIRQSVTENLNRAARLLSTEPARSVELYDEVLAEDPTNAEALTYKGWALTLAGEGADGLTSLLQAATSDPTYPDVHAFLAIVFYRNGLIDQASRELDRLDALDPPAQIRELTSGLRDKVEQARASTTTQAGGGT